VLIASGAPADDTRLRALVSDIERIVVPLAASEHNAELSRLRGTGEVRDQTIAAQAAAIAELRQALLRYALQEDDGGAAARRALGHPD
jgi:hypothetical protein